MMANGNRFLMTGHGKERIEGKKEIVYFITLWTHFNYGWKIKNFSVLIRYSEKEET